MAFRSKEGVNAPTEGDDMLGGDWTPNSVPSQRETVSENSGEAPGTYFSAGEDEER